MTDEVKKHDLTERVTNFPLLMQQVEAGTIANVLGLALSNVSRAVIASNKQGEVTLKMKIKPGTSSTGSYIEMDNLITVSEPKLSFGAKKEDFKYGTIAYVGDGGKLTYTPPRQDVHGQLSLTAVTSDDPKHASNA
ncbi:hypothetical protein K6U20_11935 [Vibrio fluvialis]|uniref:hypothetical protein n=1 Tax=Vibrio fluvialis TaxID=676 RepID=UPI001F33AA48|nr:hypothetical protein [Vibrio fluvialis]MCE7580967.1 hypothetical protein [Vibrio fluvialis]MCG6405333.1 hypothetical protein [Vibrio fluvialis]